MNGPTTDHAEFGGPDPAEGGLGLQLGAAGDGSVCVDLVTPHAVYQISPWAAGALADALAGLAEVAAQLEGQRQATRN